MPKSNVDDDGNGDGVMDFVVICQALALQKQSTKREREMLIRERERGREVKEVAATHV